MYDLLDPRSTLYIATPLIDKKFKIFPEILNELFIVSTSVDEWVIIERVYRNYPIMLPNRVTDVELVELEELDKFYFDVILVMD